MLYNFGYKRTCDSDSYLFTRFGDRGRYFLGWQLVFSLLRWWMEES